MNDDIAIKVDGVYKDFKLPHQKVNSIKSIFTGLHQKRTKSFETQHALRDVSFEVKRGEFFGIVGRNGSGKSTLLKIIAEIYHPTKGNLHKSGKLVPFIELGVGFNSELTGRENVYLNGALLGFSTKEIDAQYNDIVEFAELGPFMDQKLKNYSSGMQVRLAFSVATRAKADILLIDEVLAVGDADFQRKCFKYFKQLKKDKKTVVFVSHDMNAVREYCDRAVLIEKSKVVKIGKVSDVASAYTKMFMTSGIEDTGEKIAKKRWGNGKIAFDEITITPATPTHDDATLRVKATFTATVDVNEPLFGLTINNGAGTAMFGANNKMVGVSSKNYKAGDKGVVSWSSPNILNDGDYSLDIAAVDRDDRTEYDWWEDAASFSVRRDEHSHFAVEPPIEMEIK